MASVRKVKGGIIWLIWEVFLEVILGKVGRLKKIKDAVKSIASVTEK